MDIVDIGTEVKLNVNLDPIDGLHMSGYDFAVDFYTFIDNRLAFKKEDMTQIDDDNDSVIVATAKVGCGELKAKITAYIPDSDCKDNYRKEILSVSTDIKIK